jgi:hypothetical protein
MSDRHFELPAHPDLEYYRKQAKHLQRGPTRPSATNSSSCPGRARKTAVDQKCTGSSTCSSALR